LYYNSTVGSNKLYCFQNQKIPHSIRDIHER
jgi:hypothetical protein